MADIAKLRSLLETYGVAVRAGVITPCAADEEYFRLQLGIPEMPTEVKKDWDDSEGTRRPTTLQRPSQTEELEAGAKDELGNIVAADGSRVDPDSNDEEADNAEQES